MDHLYSSAKSKKRKIDTSGTECYALNCQTYQNAQTQARGITFHKFPDKTKNKDRYYTWVRNCRRHSEPTPSARICSQHFEPEMINRTLQRAQLREGAVPTIFSLRQHSQKTKPRLRKTSTNTIKPLEMSAPESPAEAPPAEAPPAEAPPAEAPPDEAPPDEAPLTQDHDNSDEDVRKRNLELEAENDRLRKELKKAKVCEERTRKEKLKVLQQLKDANQLNEELQLKLSSYS